VISHSRCFALDRRKQLVARLLCAVCFAHGRQSHSGVSCRRVLNEILVTLAESTRNKEWGVVPIGVESVNGLISQVGRFARLGSEAAAFGRTLCCESRPTRPVQFCFIRHSFLVNRSLSPVPCHSFLVNRSLSTVPCHPFLVTRSLSTVPCHSSIASIPPAAAT
jgi:hypothetical protein